MLFMVASQFREDPASLGVLLFEPATWRDRCLKIDRLANCRRERTAGYRLRRRGILRGRRRPALAPPPSSATPLWEEMSVWLEEWAPHSDDEAGLFFSGRGARAPNAQEIEQLLAWCEHALVHVASSPAEAWPLNDPRERTR